jgi:outer membrane receptor protein involved in Fe transport
MPLFHRLDLTFAGRYESVGPFSKKVPKFGASWSPVDSLLIRGSWSRGYRAPFVTEYLVAPSTGSQTLTDPRRTPPSTPGVAVTSGSNFNPRPEKSETEFAGVVYEPKFAKGLSLQANYYETRQTDVLQQVSAQTVVNNEAVFGDRITRANPSAADIAGNQPGQIIAVNRVFVNFGKVSNRSMDFSADYELPWENLGRWRVNLAAVRALESTLQLAPGQPKIVLDDDTASPPKWKLNASVFWNQGPWNASAFLWYMDGFNSNNTAGNPLVANSTVVFFTPTPSVTKLDVQLGYEFKKGVWRNYGKGVRVNVGVDNVFDKKPPFSDTIWGFNAGIHSQLIMGRAYRFSFVLPL